MILWKEWRETFPVFIASLVAICTVSLIRWEGWRPEFFEFQFWLVTIVSVPFIMLFLGAGAVAGEREVGTFDNLLSKPAGIFRIFLTKYLVRLGSLVLLLAGLMAIFNLIRPTHNISLYDAARGLVILFSYVLFFYTASFCVSCFTDASSKAFVASTILIFMIFLILNGTAFFKYAWLWHNSLEEWLDYLLFYGGLSLALLTAGVAILKSGVSANYGWRHVGVGGLLFFLLFFRSVSPTFWLIPQIAASGDTELLRLARKPVPDLLRYISERGKNEADLLREYLIFTDDRRIDKELINQLSNPDAGIRNQAIKILISRQTSSAAPAVIPLINDSDDAVRHSALMFIRSLHYKVSGSELIPLLSDPNSSIRQQAVWALIGAEEKEKGKYLMEALKDPNPRVSSVAAFALCQLNCTEARAELERMLLESPLRNTRRNRAYELGYMYKEPACDALIKALSDDDSSVALNSAISLAKLHCQDAVGPLSDIILAGSFPNGKMLTSRERLVVVSALGRISDPEAQKALREIFEKPGFDQITKMEIAVALAEMGDRSGIPYLRDRLAEEALKDKPNGAIRMYATRLAKIGEYCAVPGLLPWLSEGWPIQRYEIGKTLEELTGKSYGWDARKWQRWWKKNGRLLLQASPAREG